MPSIELLKEERKGILVVHRCGQPLTSKDPPPVYLLLSGFPDEPTTFDNFAKPFEQRYHVVKMCFPDMDQDTLSSFWGYSIGDVELALLAIIQEYRDKYKCTTIYLHGFDWGAAVTLQLAQHYPHMITKLVQQDIGILIPAQVSLYTAAVTVLYQGYLAGVFLCSRCLFLGNDKLANSWMGPVLRNCFPWFLVTPLWPTHVRASITPHKTYPYFRTIVDVVRGKLVFRFAKTVPQLFGYGAQKDITFHTNYYIQKLESTPGCLHKAYNGGHWFHDECETEFQKDVQDFFDQPPELDAKTD